MRGIAICALASALASCSVGAESTALDRLAPCLSDEGPTDAYCGRFEVFEDREAGAGRVISLKILVLPALGSDARSDPVFFLAGGPGQGAAQLAPQLDGMLSRLRRGRDIVLVDQRGTGDSNRLDCQFYEEDQPPPADFTVPREKVEACLAELDADVTQYTTPVAMDDLDDVRAWLGYDQINLLGGSYGTRAALVYLRRHEEHVRTIVLDGVAPPDMSLPLWFPRDMARALAKLTGDCQTDPACSQKFPTFAADVRTLLDRLESSSVRVSYEQPATGETVEVPLTRGLASGILAGVLYSTWNSSVAPVVVEQALNGEYRPLLELGSMNGGVSEVMAQGMFLSVTCSEDYTRFSPEEAAVRAEGTFLGTSVYTSRWSPCLYWPRKKMPDAFYEPVQSDKPVLILSGDLDPVTPPSWGEQVAQTLPNSRTLVAPGVGHGVMPQGCAMRLVDEFINSADPSGPDAECLQKLERPSFFLSKTGPVLLDETEAEDGND